MNKDKMELEEAIKQCKKFIQAFKKDETKSVIGFDVKAVEIVLQEMENSIPKKKIKDIIERCKKNIEESKQDDLMFIDYMEDKITAYEELLEEK